MKIWANTIVCNEENFIWFAIMSIVDFVDRVLVYDSGSTDKTVQIIKLIQKNFPDKVFLKEVGKVDKYQFTKMRQEMLNNSKCDWVLILDGDEIWWEDSIKRVRNEIENQKNTIEGIVVSMVVPVGDIYHLQEERAGKYELVGKKGHLSLRVINRKVYGLHVDLPYGKETYFDGDNRPIQERKRICFLNTPFLHVTHLKRSSIKRKQDKFKYELGNKVSSDYKFPEVFYRDYPEIIPSPWFQISGYKLLKAKILTPLRKLKRRAVG